ncbi:anthranilate synthase component 1 [Kangiella japonica]|uniref:anthranilate synthase n=1 Tax=Kangiella japonica TaxID=647384 RepID=A0ABN0ST78_9GAMM
MQVKTLSRKLPLSLNPYQAYGALTNNGNTEHTALLETAEAGTNNHQKSVIMLSAALKLTALDKSVELISLNSNGNALIGTLKSNNVLNDNFELTSSEGRLSLNLLPQLDSNDESVRLTEPTSVTVLQVIRDVLKTNNEPDNETSLLIGAFSYEVVEQYEKLPNIDKSQEDYCFYVADQLIIQQRDSQSAKIVVKGFAENADSTVRLGVELDRIYQTLTNTSSIKPLVFKSSNVNPELSVSVSDTDYYQLVETAKERIIEGDIFQVVLARTFSITCNNAYQAYGNLRTSNPSPYMYYINFGGKELFGASPESALKVNRKREVFLYPIAGTRKRMLDPVTGNVDHEQDARVEFELIADEKEGAEHMMLVDLARNDLAKVVNPGSREITQLKRIVKYSHVQHMVSEVKGILQPSIDSLVAYRACANMGTLTGAPKIKAMEIIREQETSGRGYYGGAVCTLNANDEFDSAIIIRSAVVEDGIAKISAGAGVVHDSEPQLEALETLNKAKAVIDACRANEPKSELLV